MKFTKRIMATVLSLALIAGSLAGLTLSVSATTTGTLGYLDFSAWDGTEASVAKDGTVFSKAPEVPGRDDASHVVDCGDGTYAAGEISTNWSYWCLYWNAGNMKNASGNYYSAYRFNVTLYDSGKNSLGLQYNFSSGNAQNTYTLASGAGQVGWRTVSFVLYDLSPALNFYGYWNVRFYVPTAGDSGYAIKRIEVQGFEGDKTELSSLVANQPTYDGLEDYLDSTLKSDYDNALSAAQAILNDDTIVNQGTIKAATDALKAAQEALFGTYKTGKYTFGATEDATVKTGYIGALTDRHTWGLSLSYGTNKDNITGTGLIPPGEPTWVLNWFKIDTSAITGGVATDLEVEINYGWHNDYGGEATRKVMGVCRSELATGDAVSDLLTDGETSFVIGASLNVWDYNADQCLGVPNDGMYNTTVFPVNGAKDSVTVFGYFAGDPVALVIHSITIRPATPEKDALETAISTGTAMLAEAKADKLAALQAALANAQTAYDNFHAPAVLSAVTADLRVATLAAGKDASDLAALIASRTYGDLGGYLNTTKKANYDAAVTAAQELVTAGSTDMAAIKTAYENLQAAGDALFGVAPKTGSYTFGATAEATVKTGDIGALTDLKTWGQSLSYSTNASIGTGLFPLADNGNSLYWFQIDTSAITGGVATNLEVEVNYGWHNEWGGQENGTKRNMGVCRSELVNIAQEGASNARLTDGETYFVVGSSFSKDYINYDETHCLGVPKNFDNTTVFPVNGAKNSITFFGFKHGGECIVFKSITIRVATPEKDALEDLVDAGYAAIPDSKPGKVADLEAALASAELALDNFNDPAVFTAVTESLTAAIDAAAKDVDDLAALIASRSYAGAENYLNSAKKTAYDNAVAAAQALINAASTDKATIKTAYNTLKAAGDALFIGNYKTGKYTFGATEAATVKEGSIGALTDLKTWGGSLSYGTNKDNITGTGLITVANIGHSLNWFQIDTSAITGGVAMDLEVEINYGWHSDYGGNAARKIMGVCRSELVNNAAEGTCYARMEDSYFVKGASFDPDLDDYNKHYTDAYCLGVPTNGMYNTTVFPVNGAKNSVTVFGYYGGDSVALVIHSITIRPATPNKDAMAAEVTAAETKLAGLNSDAAKNALSTAINTAKNVQNNFYDDSVFAGVKADLVAAEAAADALEVQAQLQDLLAEADNAKTATGKALLFRAISEETMTAAATAATPNVTTINECIDALTAAMEDGRYLAEALPAYAQIVADDNLTIRVAVDLSEAQKAALNDGGVLGVYGKVGDADFNLPGVEYYEIVDDLYVFEIGQISPNHIGDGVEITPYLNYNDSTTEGYKITTNMQNYCLGLYNSGNEVYKELGIALLNYATAYQAYLGETGDVALNEVLDEEDREIYYHDFESDYEQTGSAENPIVTWKDATVALNNDVTMIINMDLAAQYSDNDDLISKVVVTVDGEKPVEAALKKNDDGTWQVKYRLVSPSEILKPLTFVAKNLAGNTLSTELTYSIATYALWVPSTIDNYDGTMDLLNTLYSYGEAVADYNAWLAE